MYIVGANTARPAVEGYEFAENQCEYVTFYRTDERCSPLHFYSINVV